MESRLKALQKKLSKFNELMGGDEADAAGIRKQLLQRFNCISCDNPVKMGPQPPVPSLPQVGKKKNKKKNKNKRKTKKKTRTKTKTKTKTKKKMKKKKKRKKKKKKKKKKIRKKRKRKRKKRKGKKKRKKNSTKIVY